MASTRSGNSYRLTSRAWVILALASWAACIAVGCIGYNAVQW